MKKLLLIILVSLLLFSGTAFGADKAVKFSYEHDGVDVAGFRLHWGLATGVYSNIIDIVYAVDQGSYITNVQIPALANEETTYFFVMTAFDADNNQSVYSNEVSAVIDFKPPGAVFNLTVEVIKVP